MIFFELFFGCLLKLAPYSVFGIYPFKESLRFSKKKTIWLTALFVSTICVIFSIVYYYLKSVFLPNYTLFTKAYFVFIICRFICVLWYLYVIKGLWQKKLFIFLFGAISSNIIYVIVTITEKFFEKTSENTEFLPFTGYAFVLTAILTAIAIPLSLLLLKRAYLPVSDSITSKESNYLAIVSILLYFVLRAEALSISYAKKLSIEQISFYFTLVFAVYFIYIVIFKILFYANEKLLSQQKYSQIEQQFVIQEQQYHRIYENIENTQRIRHDLRHHMVLIERFLNCNEIKKKQEYLSSFIQSLDDSMLVKICENPTIDLIVGYYNELAKERSIDFQARINIPKDIRVQDIDISVLLGNLLENSLEAATSAPVENRYIHLNIIHTNKMLVITVDNGYQTNFKKVGNRFLSTKKNHRGLGISSIEHIAKKYNGNTDFNYDDKEFHASVMIKVDY